MVDKYPIMWYQEGDIAPCFYSDHQVQAAIDLRKNIEDQFQRYKKRFTHGDGPKPSGMELQFGTGPNLPHGEGDDSKRVLTEEFRHRVLTRLEDRAERLDWKYVNVDLDTILTNMHTMEGQLGAVHKFLRNSYPGDKKSDRFSRVVDQLTYYMVYNGFNPQQAIILGNNMTPYNPTLATGQIKANMAKVQELYDLVLAGTEGDMIRRSEGRFHHSLAEEALEVTGGVELPDSPEIELIVEDPEFAISTPVSLTGTSLF